MSKYLQNNIKPIVPLFQEVFQNENLWTTMEEPVKSKYQQALFWVKEGFQEKLIHVTSSVDIFGLDFWQLFSLAQDSVLDRQIFRISKSAFRGLEIGKF